MVHHSKIWGFTFGPALIHFIPRMHACGLNNPRCLHSALSCLSAYIKNHYMMITSWTCSQMDGVSAVCAPAVACQHRPKSKDWEMEREDSDIRLNEDCWMMRLNRMLLPELPVWLRKPLVLCCNSHKELMLWALNLTFMPKDLTTEASL